MRDDSGRREADVGDGGLEARERDAAAELIRRVRHGVRAELVQAALFGSKARGQGRPDSDVDVLLVWRRLPPDREPHAGDAEAIAARVAAETGVPLGVWSVSLADLERGWRTPMLVDALADAVPLWPPSLSVPRVPFTPEDAVYCAGQLLDRVAEGGDAVARQLRAGDPRWARRLRDDLMRLCTAVLVLAGDTRPRRGDAVRAVLTHHPLLPLDPHERTALAWAARSYPAGHVELDDESPVSPPPVPLAPLLALMERLRALVRQRRDDAARLRAFVR